MPTRFNAKAVPIETYKALVDRCASERLDYPIANGSPFHARILIGKLFEIAEREISIVTGKLTVTNPENIDVYGYPDVMRRAREFLSDPGTKLSILIESGNIDGGWENKFLVDVVNAPDRNGDVVVFTPERREIDFDVPHFMVADAEAYRLETASDAREKRDINSMTAIANFGDKSVASSLGSYFNELATFFRRSAHRSFAAGQKI